MWKFRVQAETAESAISGRSKAGQEAFLQPGLLLVVAASLLWSFAGPLVRASGLGTKDVVFLRGLAALAFYAAISVWLFTRHAVRFSWTHPGVLAGGVTHGATSILLIYAFTHTSPFRATLIQFVTPVLVTHVVAAWSRKSWPSRLECTCMALAFAGVAMTFLGARPSATTLLGDAAALGSGLAFAGLSLLASRRAKGPAREARSNAQSFGDSVLILMIGTISALAWSLASGVTWPLWEHEGSSLGLVLVLGVLSTACANMLYLKGTRLAGAHTSTLATVLEPALSPVWMAVALEETLTWSEVVGPGLALFSIALMLTRSARPVAVPLEGVQ